MTSKKRGFWLFVFSLIPGAGEMYLGFFKQGLSIMAILFAFIAGATWLNLGPIMFFLPVLWFYSFFHVHNLASLSDEEFYAIQDDYLFNFNDEKFKSLFAGDKGRKVLAFALILIGVSAVWNIFCDYLNSILEMCGIDTSQLYYIFDKVPQLVFAVLIIWLGVYLIKGKKKELDAIEEKDIVD